MDAKMNKICLLNMKKIILWKSPISFFAGDIHHEIYITLKKKQ